MELKINNFRGVNNWSGVFNSGLTLLKGSSGCGKSTILEAIRWCLYGQLRQVFPFNGNKKTVVILIINDITIARRKNPDNVIWERDNLKLESTIAQEQINNYFGSKAIWQNSAYINQNERITLLAGSQVDKLELIKELVFQGDKEKSENIFNKFKSKSTELDKDNEKYNYMLDKLKKDMDDYKEQNQEKLDKIKKDFYTSKLYKSKDILVNKEKELETIIRENEEQKVINNLIIDYQKIKDDNEKELDKYPKDLNQQKFYNWQQYLTLKEKLLNITFDENLVIEEDLDTLVNLCAINNNNKLILGKYNLIEENILNEKNKINQQIENFYKYESYEKDFKLYQNYKTKLDKCTDYINQLEQIKIKIDKLWQNILTTLHLEITDFNQLTTVKIKELLDTKKTNFLTCPGCDKHLVIKNNNLEFFNKLDDSIDIDKITKNLDKIIFYHNNLNEAKNQVKILTENEIIEPDVIENPRVDDFNTLKKKQLDVNNYKKVNIDKVNEKIKKLKLLQLREEYQTEIENLYLPFFDDYSINGENYFTSFVRIKNNYTNADNYLKKYKTKEIIDIESKEKLLVRVKDNLAIIKEQEELHTYGERLKKYKNDYNQEKNKFDKSLKEIKYCNKIMKIIKNSENESFEEFLSYFNVLVNDILTIVFDNCHINLKSFKEDSKNKITKAYLDLHIYIDGHKYENWNSLSGGEKDRISLAITIALNYIKQNKFLLLDECMASLDGVNREKCLKALKKYLGNQIVVNICHETIEGYYDNIITDL